MKISRSSALFTQQFISTIYLDEELNTSENEQYKKQLPFRNDWFRYHG